MSCSGISGNNPVNSVRFDPVNKGGGASGNKPPGPNGPSGSDSYEPGDGYAIFRLHSVIRAAIPYLLDAKKIHSKSEQISEALKSIELNEALIESASDQIKQRLQKIKIRTESKDFPSVGLLDGSTLNFDHWNGRVSYVKTPDIEKEVQLYNNEVQYALDAGTPLNGRFEGVIQKFLDDARDVISLLTDSDSSAAESY